MQNLNDVFEAMKKNADLNWEDLPSWGEEPENTQQVWSWDAKRAIVGTCAGDIEIVDRDEIDC